MSSKFTQPPVNSFCYMRIPAADVARAKAFYSKVFGWEFREPAPGYPEDQLAIFFTPAGNLMGGISKAEMKPSDEHSQVLSFIMVENVEEALKQVTAAGGSVHQEKISEGGHTDLAQFKDTEGNQLGLLKWTM